jgi:hypothetical protein
MVLYCSQAARALMGRGMQVAMRQVMQGVVAVEQVALGVHTLTQPLGTQPLSAARVAVVFS